MIDYRAARLTEARELTLFRSSGKVMESQMYTRNFQNCCSFIGGTDGRIIVSGDAAALIRPWHEQNIRTKSQRCLVVPRGDMRQTLAHAAKSPKPQTQCPRPIGRNRRRSGNRQRQIAAKLATFLTGIRRLINANAVLWQNLYARFSDHTFDQGNRVLVSRVATHLDIRDRVSMNAGRLSQVPSRPIQRRTRHPDLCTCATVTSDKVTAMITMSPNQRGIQ
jgi:hypothetical protein